MAFLENCAAQNVNPAQYIHQRALEMGWRANGRVPHSAQAQHQPATMEQLANMSDKQFKQAMKQPKPRRVQVDEGQLSRMDDKTFDEMFESMKQSSANKFAFGD
ncbi:hypothetical protein D3C75_463600 [compost metagenome]